MRPEPNTPLDCYRLLDVPGWESDLGANWGAFEILCPRAVFAQVISSGTDEEHGWEHVSVSLKHRTPTWEEMCIVKDFFWDPEECVLQFHPPKSLYIDQHPYCLHLWKPLRYECVLPPAELIGVRKED